MKVGARLAAGIGFVWLGAWLVVASLGGEGQGLATVVRKGTPVGSSTSKKSAVLDRLGDKHRTVVVFGLKPDDDKMNRQRRAWTGALPEAGIKDRDIVVIEVPAEGEGKVGDEPLKLDEARELREVFAITADAFAVVLVGRDGGEKARWADPVSAQEVFGKVDAMPMRQNEVRAKGGGSE